MIESIVNTIKYLITTFLIGTQTMISPVAPERNIFIETYPNVVIENLWFEYRDKIQKDGRTIDRERNYLTTSEGQSYSLLRAVWMDDKATFDKVLTWTNNNLRKRETDKLFAWMWGQSKNGSWGIIFDEGGLNTATDADQDIALALIFASKRWNEERYIKQAREILADIWEIEVIEIQGEPYLLAGNWAKSEAFPTINPSYFSFAAYPIFAEVDPEHDWLALRDTSYKVLKTIQENPLEKENTVGLPPDWVSIDPTSGEILKASHFDKTVAFSDDAIRVPWRVALDWKWHRNPQAKEYLESLTFLQNEWTKEGKILARYAENGTPLVTYQSNSLYGAILPAMQIVNEDLAKEIYVTKIASLYDKDLEKFHENKDLGYYSQNWVWFGMALYENKLLNLNNIEGITDYED
ncbi:MAG: glycosyl hydrolase family 8 [Patescibacteria group bacterium]